MERAQRAMKSSGSAGLHHAYLLSPISHLNLCGGDRMKQSTEIRPAREADMGAVGRLYTDSWQRTYRGLIPDWVLDEMTPEKSRDKWTRYREQKENGLFVLERDGAVAGLVACRPFPERENSALLDSLHVAPEAQGGGWGRRLIARAARWARENGFRELVIYVVQGNRRAERLYRGMGARELCAFHDWDGALSWALAWEDLESLEQTFS